MDSLYHLTIADILNYKLRRLNKESEVTQMVSHEEYLMDFYGWIVVITVFCSYTNAVQTKTLSLGKSLFGGSTSSTGIQDAITPPWQTRNNLISLFLAVAFAFTAMYVLVWYLGLLVALLVYFLVVPLVARHIVLRYFSPQIVRKIKESLITRKNSFEDEGDLIRVQAIDDILIRLNELHP